MKFFDTLLAAMKMAPEEARKVLGLDKVDPEGKIEVFGTVVLPRQASREEVLGECQVFQKGDLDLVWSERLHNLLSGFGSSHRRFRFVTFTDPREWCSPIDFVEYAREVNRGLCPYAAYGYQKIGNQTKVPREPVVAALEVSLSDVVGILRMCPQVLLQAQDTNNAFVLAGWGELQDPMPAIYISRWGCWAGGNSGTGGWGGGYFSENLLKYHRVSRLFFPDPA